MEIKNFIPNKVNLTPFYKNYKKVARHFEVQAMNIIRALYNNIDEIVPDYTGDVYIELKLSLLDNVGISNEIIKMINDFKRKNQNEDVYGYWAMQANETTMCNKNLYQLSLVNGKWVEIMPADWNRPEAYEHFVYQKELYDDITTCFKSNNAILKSAKSEIYMEEAPIFTFHYIMEVDDKLLHDNIFKNFYQKYKY